MGARSGAAATVLLIDFGAGAHGHRGPWNRLFARLFELRPAAFGWRSLFSVHPVFVPAIEHGPFGFVVLALVRGLLGRRTVGIVMRPLPALQGRRLGLRLKRLALRILRHGSATRVLTIIPFAAEPGFAAIAHGWIRDPQEWDLAVDPAGLDGQAQATAQAIRLAAGDRAVCCAVGGLNADKGFDRFARVFLAHADLRRKMLPAFGGAVAADLKPAAAQLVAAGAVGMDRYVGDDELFALHAAADLVWCHYAPGYDQASGILGRAMQTGTPAVVRTGSIVERLCAIDGHPCIAFDPDEEWPRLLAAPPPRERDQALALAREKGASSLATLANALGVAPAWNPFAGAHLA